MSRSRWPRDLAAAHGHRLHRGASRRADITHDAGASRRPEPVPFLSSVPAIIRYAAASISWSAPHIPRQDIAEAIRVIGDGDRISRRFLRDKLVHGRVSQGDRANADRLSSKPLKYSPKFARTLNASVTLRRSNLCNYPSSCALSQSGGPCMIASQIDVF